MCRRRLRRRPVLPVQARVAPAAHDRDARRARLRPPALNALQARSTLAVQAQDARLARQRLRPVPVPEAGSAPVVQARDARLAPGHRRRGQCTPGSRQGYRRRRRRHRSRTLLNILFNWPRLVNGKPHLLPF
jgi:hypothetical protein